MAFRKRNIAVGRQPSSPPPSTPTDEPAPPAQTPGVRPSPLTSHPTTSTGAASLDGLLGGHSGLPLGTSLFIGEHDTTDFAGALLRYYAAEGILQGHTIHIVGVGEGWVRDLPGVAEAKYQKSDAPVKEEKGDAAAQQRMKIAWRYERMGQAGERGRKVSIMLTVLPDRSIPSSTSASPAQAQAIPFCHTFDLTKRLVGPQGSKINHIPISTSASPFRPVLDNLKQQLATCPPNTIHRLIVPTLLSPAIYPPHAAKPEHIIRFLHALRVLLRKYPAQLTAMLTLPLTLSPRSTALTRTLETLSDGVLELTPFPHLMDAFHPAHDANSKEEHPQGLVRVHRLPLITERGEGGAGAGNTIGEDLAFTLSRRKFLISPFSLPPMEGDQEAQAQTEDGGGKVSAKAVEF